MQVLCANQQVGRVVACVLILFLRCQARFFHRWAQGAREKTTTSAHDESSEFHSFTMCVSAFARVRVRVAPPGGLGAKFPRTVCVSCSHLRIDVQ